MDLLNDPRIQGRDIHRSFVTLDFTKFVPLFDSSALLNKPLCNGNFFCPFTNIKQLLSYYSLPWLRGTEQTCSAE